MASVSMILADKRCPCSLASSRWPSTDAGISFLSASASSLFRPPIERYCPLWVITVSLEWRSWAVAVTSRMSLPSTRLRSMFAFGIMVKESLEKSASDSGGLLANRASLDTLTITPSSISSHRSVEGCTVVISLSGVAPDCKWYLSLFGLQAFPGKYSLRGTCLPGFRTLICRDPPVFVVGSVLPVESAPR